MTEQEFHPDGSTPQGSDWIFVFGSNLAGRHGAGAALVARRRFGAETGVGHGMTGQAYAIPTKDEYLRVLPLSRVDGEIVRFIEHARENPGARYFVTRVGCGLAGYKDEQIAPLFASAPLNCSLPRPWECFIGEPSKSLPVAKSRFARIARQ